MTLSPLDTISTSYIPKKSRVLDLGCADGKLGKYLINHLDCYVVGVEKEKKQAKIAQKCLHKVIIGNLENQQIIQLIKRQEKFDVIFASSILEHLTLPQNTIKGIIPSLKKNGVIIITLPNVAYWLVRLNLLFGNFNYTKSGILDITHLRFFTIKTARNFISKDCSLKILTTEYDFPQLPIASKLLSYLKIYEFQTKIFKRFPNLFAYQVLFVTKAK